MEYVKIICPECKNEMPLPKRVIDAHPFIDCPNPKCSYKIDTREYVSPQIPSTPPTPQAPVQTVPFVHTVTFKREEDGFEYYFFPDKPDKKTFGRYDSSVQSTVLIKTEDVSISRRHLLVEVKEDGNGYKATVTNLCENAKSVCLIENESIPYKGSKEIKPGMTITIGRTRFVVKDINTNK